MTVTIGETPCNMCIYKAYSNTLDTFLCAKYRIITLLWCKVVLHRYNPDHPPPKSFAYYIFWHICTLNSLAACTSKCAKCIVVMIIHMDKLLVWHHYSPIQYTCALTERHKLEFCKTVQSIISTAQFSRLDRGAISL